MATPNDNAPLGLPALAGQQRSNQDQSVPPYMRVAMEQEYTKMTVREEEQVRDASAVVRRAAEYYSRYAELTTVNSRFKASAIPTLSSVSHRSKSQMIR